MTREKKLLQSWTSARDDRLSDLRAFMAETNDPSEIGEFHEYGLEFSFEHAHGGGYFRYLLSCGGPQEEIRFYVGIDRRIYKVEFWLLDWGQGFGGQLTGDDLDAAKFAWDELTSYGEFLPPVEDR